MNSDQARAGLVLGGGGARAAYQAGFLLALARRWPDLDLPIRTGVSAGAINTALLSNHAGSFRDGAEDLALLWHGLRVQDVFRASPLDLVRRLLRTGAQMAAGLDPGERAVEGVVDTGALREFLHRSLGTRDGSLPGIAGNVREGRLAAVGLTATCYGTGESVTFCAGGREPDWSRPRRRGVATALRVDHVMASSSLPLFYPSVPVDGAWYGDGEIGLVTPLAPAIHLGADRILAISTWPPAGSAPAREMAVHPTPGEVLAILHGALFAERLDHDAGQAARINLLLRRLPPGDRGDMREVEVLVIRPSEDLGALVLDPGIEVPRSLRFLARRLDLRRPVSRDLLSVVMLDPSYHDRVMAIGERDGERRADEIGGFLGLRARRSGVDQVLRRSRRDPRQVDHPSHPAPSTGGTTTP